MTARACLGVTSAALDAPSLANPSRQSCPRPPASGQAIPASDAVWSKAAESVGGPKAATGLATQAARLLARLHAPTALKRVTSRVSPPRVPQGAAAVLALGAALPCVALLLATPVLPHARATALPPVRPRTPVKSVTAPVEEPASAAAWTHGRTTHTGRPHTALRRAARGDTRDLTTQDALAAEAGAGLRALGRATVPTARPERGGTSGRSGEAPVGCSNAQPRPSAASDVEEQATSVTARVPVALTPLGRRPASQVVVCRDGTAGSGETASTLPAQPMADIRAVA